ncbi:MULTISPECIES: fatty acid desaturase family protein [unclassified Providencia]|uniref:fatty acid desaturase family protein n=1 Tax=unclassified Providencia TaxID=2633465 RepID=UPI0012B50868|nr:MULTISPECIES: acyl-CoA desaturase [unclassified Providencia]MTC23533.1 acyl-CoA desaturase [Providencia sp. wls1938]MTC79199.1 acyl-CoA desaturase [Providencia sp. wls1916]
MYKPKPLPPLAFRQRDDLAFHRALQQAAKGYLQEKGDHRFADGWVYLKSFMLILVCLGSYGLMLSSQGGILFFVGYPLFIFFALLLAINMVHDASHNAVFQRGALNRIVNFWVTIPLGLDPDCWRVRHIVFHHSHTNVRDYDLDIEENFLLRQTPYQRWYPFMRWQHLYWPLIAAMTFLALIWGYDWFDRFHFTRVAPKMRYQGAKGIGVFFLSKSLHLALAILLPYWVLSPYGIGIGTLLGVYLLSQMFASFIFVVLILGTHWAKATFYTAPDSGRMEQGFYTHTFSTTYDWQTTPKCLTYWLGGLNLHLTHHLFPNWHHRHYPALARIIQQTAAQFGMDYHCVDAKTLWRYQQRFLKRMGTGEGVR